jgi:ribosome-binding ATPase YchF (GTP1/OBG family)
MLRVCVCTMGADVGDVDPMRDLTIISDELRIKDIEFVEKHLEALSKITNRGGASLEVKAKKEEQAIVQKVLQHLLEEKDVRKGDWSNKEVLSPLSFASYVMTKSHSARIIPARRAHLSHEIIIL